MPADLITGLQLAIRAAAAAALSAFVADVLDYDPGTYAVIAAVVVTDVSPVETRRLALQRIAGTVLGAAVGGVVSSWMRPSPWSIGLAVLASILLCRALRLPASSRLAGYLAGIIVLVHAGSALDYTVRRSIETIGGIVAAVVVSWIPHLIPVAQAPDDLRATD